MKILVSSILPNPQQPRARLDESTIRERAESLRINGQLQPILVEAGAGHTYILIDGECRWRAAKLLGWSEIEAVVRPAQNGSGPQERTVLALVANLQRSNLNAVEEGRAYEALAGMGISNAAIAHRVGANVNRVAHRRAILKLPDEILDLMAADLLPIDQRVVDALESVPAEYRIAFARKLARPGLRIATVQKAVEKLVAALNAAKVQDDPGLYFAHKKAGRPHLPAWDALVQAGALPPWEGVVSAARQTCQACELRPEACATICSRCPAVSLLSALIERTHEHRSPAR